MKENETVEEIKIKEIIAEMNDYLKKYNLIIEDWESNNEEKIFNKYRPYHLLISSFFEFSLLSLKLSLYRSKEKWTKKEAMVTGISTVTFWRFRSSYLIFKKGYPVESISLLRGIFENILTIIALLKDIIDTENTFTEFSSNINLSNKEIVKKELTKGIFKINNKVKKSIIGEKSNLSLETRNFFDTVFSVMHNSTHRSMMNIIRHVFPWYQGKKILYPLPVIDDEHLRAFINLSLYLAWIIINIFPNIYKKELNSNRFFVKKYNSIDKLFEKMLSKDKNKKYIKEFIFSINIK